jgi:hypothetical protein
MFILGMKRLKTLDGLSFHPVSPVEIVRHFGRPSLFITFTTIAFLGLQFEAQGDAARTPSRQRLWEHVASVYTFKFQNRGLPHTHILLYLYQFDEKIDEVISAEIFGVLISNSTTSLLSL